MIMSLDFMHFFNGQELSADGSNFIKWYLRLRTSLQRKETLFMIIKPLGSPPELDADQATINAFLL
jgi:hypothetical protein